MTTSARLRNLGRPSPADRPGPERHEAGRLAGLLAALDRRDRGAVRRVRSRLAVSPDESGRRQYHAPRTSANTRSRHGAATLRSARCRSMASCARRATSSTRPRNSDCCRATARSRSFSAIPTSDDILLFYAQMIADLEGSSAKVPGSDLWRMMMIPASEVHVDAAAPAPVQASRLPGRRQPRSVDAPLSLGPRLRRKPVPMSDFGARLRNNLEPFLAMADPREKISAYHDMPYAIFHYDPEQELSLRREVSSLQTRLENKGKRITRISLAECLDAALKVGSDPWRNGSRTSANSAPKRRSKTSTSCSRNASRWSISLPSGCRPIPIRARTSSSSSEPARCSRSTARSRCWSNSRDASSCRRSSSIRATSTARPGFDFMGVLDAEHNYRPKIF